MLLGLLSLLLLLPTSLVFSDLVNCPLGRGGNACLPCSPGFYKDIQGYTPCQPCDPGTYLLSTGATSSKSCLPCPQGTYSNTPSQACKSCPPHTTSPTKSLHIRDCLALPGFYAIPGQPGIPCPTDYYCPATCMLPLPCLGNPRESSVCHGESVKTSTSTSSEWGTVQWLYVTPFASVFTVGVLFIGWSRKMLWNFGGHDNRGGNKGKSVIPLTINNE